MANDNLQFPQYRKYPNDKGFFKIFSAEAFEEITIMGSRYSISQFQAKIHPDRLYIKDLLHHYHDHYKAISEEEYDAVKQKCEKELTPMSFQ